MSLRAWRGNLLICLLNAMRLLMLGLFLMELMSSLRSVVFVVPPRNDMKWTRHGESSPVVCVLTNNGMEEGTCFVVSPHSNDMPW